MCGCTWWCCDTTWTCAYTKVATTTANNNKAIQGRTPFCFFLLRAAMVVLGCPPPLAARPYVDGVALAIISEATFCSHVLLGLRMP